MREKLIQLICKHDWLDAGTIYHRERSGKGTMEKLFVCKKCRKVKKLKGSVGYIR